MPAPWLASPPPEIAAVGSEELADRDVQRAAVVEPLRLLEHILPVDVRPHHLGPGGQTNPLVLAGRRHPDVGDQQVRTAFVDERDDCLGVVAFANHRDRFDTFKQVLERDRARYESSASTIGSGMGADTPGGRDGST